MQVRDRRTNSLGLKGDRCAGVGFIPREFGAPRGDFYFDTSGEITVVVDTGPQIAESTVGIQQTQQFRAQSGYVKNMPCAETAPKRRLYAAI